MAVAVLLGFVVLGVMAGLVWALCAIVRGSRRGARWRAQDIDARLASASGSAFASTGEPVIARAGRRQTLVLAIGSGL